MAATPSTLRLAPPTLARVGTASRVSTTVDGVPLWIESEDATLVARPETFACAMLVPALLGGYRLVVGGEVDPGFAANLPVLVEVLRAWWGCEGSVELEGVARAGAAPVAAAGLAFSGGADSFHVLRRGSERPDVLVHVHGFDVPLADRRRAAAAHRSVREVAASVGARAVVVRTNLRAHPRFAAAPWEDAHGGALFAVGHAVSSAVGRLRVAASWHVGLPCPYGTHPRTDPLWGGTHVAFASVGAALSRFDKLRELAADPLVQRHLRVCWVNESASSNCGRCDKCVRTRLVLEQGGVAHAFPTMATGGPIERAVDRLVRVPDWIHQAHVAVELGRGLAPPVAAATRRLLARSRPRGAPARADHAWATVPAPPGLASARGDAWRVGPPRVEPDGDGRRVVVDVAGAPLWFASRDADLVPRAEAFASALLFPALSRGARLDVAAPVDGAFAEGSAALDPILRSWWGPEGPAATFADVRAVPAARGHATAFAFGGGVASFDALVRGLVRPEVLVFALGLDVPLDDVERVEAAERSFRAVAGGHGARAVVVRTNLRAHPAFAGVPSVPAEGGVVAALGHLLAGEVGELVVGAPQHAHYIAPHGLHPRTLPLSGSSSLALRLVGDDRWRAEKVASLVADPGARAHLRVCWRGRGAAANCGRCEKCLRTMTSLEAAGALGDFGAFPPSEPLAARIDRLAAVDGEWALAFETDLGRGLPKETARAVRALLLRSGPRRRPPLARMLARLRRHALRWRS